MQQKTVIKNPLPAIILLIILFLAYLPLSTFYFGMKNDAFADNFPDKYFLSQAIHSGMSPLWNPYMNFGFPIYADFGFAFYNPITWLFAAIGYNAYTLTAEVLLYIFIAGISMFSLAKSFKFTNTVSLAVAVMYMCSGFFPGHLQYINFITAAAFLPLLIKQLLTLFNQPCFKNSFLLLIPAYFLAVSGHPAIPIASVFFISVFSVLILIKQKKSSAEFLKIIGFLLFTIICLIVILSPLIYSYSSIFNEYKRYAVTQPDTQLFGFFNTSSFLSLLFPFATIAKSTVFTNDVSCRNIYFSITGLLLFFIVLRERKKDSVIMPLFISGVLMFFLSAGGQMKDKIPFLNYIKTNGEFVIFSILCFSCIAGFGLMQLNASKVQVLIKKVSKLLLAASVLLFLIITFTSYKEIELSISKLKSINDFSSKISFFLSAISFQQALLIALPIAIVILSCIAFKKNLSVKYIGIIIIADLVINTILYLPVTGVGQITLSQIQAIYNSTPDGIPVPSFTPLKGIDTLDAKTTGLVGDITYYNKKIGTTRLTDYPSYFTSTAEYFKSNYRDSLLNKPWLFLKNENDSAENKISVGKFSPTNILVNVKSTKTDSLILLQNYYKNWKVFVNEKEVPVAKSYITFMGVELQAGENHVEFIYKDEWLLPLIFLGIVFFLGLFFLYLFKWRKSNEAFSS